MKDGEDDPAATGGRSETRPGRGDPWQRVSEYVSINDWIEKETNGRRWLDSQIRNLTADLEQTREQLDEEQEGRTELQRQVSKLVSEVQPWRSRYETEGKRNDSPQSLISS